MKGDPAALAADLRRHLEQGGRLWLFLDYDGTLADFAPTPDHVLPDPQVIGLVSRLAAHPQVRVTVISGRRLAHVRKLMPVEGLILAGTYGIELLHPGGEPVFAATYEEVRPVLDAVVALWEDCVAGREGFYLEDKGWALALHARFAADEEAEQVLAEAYRLASEAAPEEHFRLLGGHKFLEVGPSLAGKGRAVAAMLEGDAWGAARLVYVGDDDKDEEAFEVIRKRGGEAVVVAAAERPSHARYRLEAPEAVREWLGSLVPEGHRPVGEAGGTGYS